MIGPGRYNEECTELRERLQASGIILAVVGGSKGNGFSLQFVAGPETAAMPAILRRIAEQIEKDLSPNPQN